MPDDEETFVETVQEETDAPVETAADHGIGAPAVVHNNAAMDEDAAVPVPGGLPPPPPGAAGAGAGG